MNTIEKKVDALVRLCLCEDEVEKNDILNSLREMVETKTPVSDYHSKVVNALLELGAPDRLIGHKYLVYAIERAIEDPKSTDQITKVFYPEIAEKFGTTPSRVERAIRHLIEVTLDRADCDTITKYFGGTIHPHKGKPTNSEFFARMANALR